MARDKLSIGIIGANVRYGWGTRAHLPAIKALPEVDLVAVATRSLETARETAQHYGALLAFDNPEDLAGHPDVDAVIVSTRAPTHHALVDLALKAGKHVFCEWPLGANLKQAMESRDLAESKGVRHMVGLQARGAPEFSYVKELVGEGYIGQVLSATLNQSLPGAGTRVATFPEGVDRTQGVGTLAIAGGHSIDALCFCLGEFRELSGVVSTQVKKALVKETGAVLDVTAPDNVSVSGTLASGGVVSAHIKNVPDFGTGMVLEIDGTEGSLVVTSPGSAQIEGLTLSGARKGDRGRQELPVPEKHRWVPPDTPSGAPFNVAQLLRRFAGAIRDGSTIDPDFSLAVTRHEMLDAIQRSSDSGQRQALQTDRGS